MSEVTDAFVRRVIAAQPSLEPAFRKHLEALGELIPHPFMSVAARTLGQQFDSGGAAAVQPALELIEAEWGQDPEVDNVIAVSFIEMLPYPGEAGAGIVDILGPQLSDLADDLR